MESSDWRAELAGLTQRSEHLLHSKKFSDCKFIVSSQPEQVFEAHKAVLAVSSPVFETMFYGSIPERNPVLIKDVQPETFRALLEYIYTDKTYLSSIYQARDLCYTAIKYMMPRLVKVCIEYMQTNLHPKNVCKIYEFAKLVEEPILMEKCFETIRSKTKEVLSDSSFTDIKPSTFLKILDQERLAIESEMLLFEALSRFSMTHQSNSEKNTTNSDHRIFRDALKKIRFLSLTPKQFADGSASSDLLTQTEKLAIFMNLCSTTTDVSMPEGFSTCRCQRTGANVQDSVTPTFHTNSNGIFCHHQR